MSSEYRIRITPLALADLEGIFEYIRADSLENAGRMIRRILDAIDSLEILPYRYPVPRGAPGDNIRSMLVRP